MSIKKYAFDTDGSVAIINSGRGQLFSGGYVIKDGKITHSLTRGSLSHFAALDIAVAVHGGGQLAMADKIREKGTQEISWLGEPWCLMPLSDMTLERLKDLPAAGFDTKMMEALEEYLKDPQIPRDWKSAFTHRRPKPPTYHSR
jgi:hypothetical protein